MLLIDTNIVLEYKKLKLFFRTKEWAITKPCLLEIKKIAKEKKDPVLLELIDKIKVIKTKEKNADKSILEAAKKYKLSVATFDRILIKKLRESEIRVLNSNKEIFREFS
jgi:rRNA-processing protein FCF1